MENTKLNYFSDLFCVGIRQEEQIYDITRFKEENSFDYLGYGLRMTLPFAQRMKINEMKPFLSQHLVENPKEEMIDYDNSKMCIKKGSFGDMTVSSVNSTKIFFKRLISSSALLEVELSKCDFKDKILIGTTFFVNEYDFYSIYNYDDILITLRTVSEKKNLTKEQCVFCLKEIANGLNILHEKGIIHCNLSQDSIFVKNNCLKIANFTYACLPKYSTNEIPAKNLNFPYNGPDQIWKIVPLTFSTDIWSLGIILAELISKKRNYPFPLIGNEFSPVAWQKVQFQSNYNAKLKFACPLTTDLANQCLNFTSQLRPNLRQILMHNLLTITQQLF